MEKTKTLDKLNVGRVIEHVPLNEYTTYRVGGIARALVIVDDKEALKKSLLRPYFVPYFKHQFGKIAKK